MKISQFSSKTDNLSLASALYAFGFPLLSSEVVKTAILPTGHELSVRCWTFGQESPTFGSLSSFCEAWMQAGRKAPCREDVRVVRVAMQNFRTLKRVRKTEGLTLWAQTEQGSTRLGVHPFPSGSVQVPVVLNSPVPYATHPWPRLEGAIALAAGARVTSILRDLGELRLELEPMPADLVAQVTRCRDPRWTGEEKNTSPVALAAAAIFNKVYLAQGDISSELLALHRGTRVALISKDADDAVVDRASRHLSI